MFFPNVDENLREELVDIVREEIVKYEIEGISCYEIVDRVIARLKLEARSYDN